MTENLIKCKIKVKYFGEGLLMIKKRSFVSVFLSLCIFYSIFCFGNISVINAEAKPEAVKYVTTNKQYKMDGRPILNFKIKRPVFTVKTKANKKINNYFKKLCTKYRVNALKFAKETFQENPNNPMVHSFDDKITLTYNNNGKYSFKEKFVEFTGGVHPQYGTVGHNFSKKSGNKIPNSKLTKYSNKELKAKIYRKVEHLYNQYPNRFFPNALETVENKQIKDYTFYLTDKHLNVVFQCYEIASWASGPTTVKIKL